VREFDPAIADLERAASLIAGKPDDVEPDGQPNARNIPTSTLHTNIWYHLALTRYLKADYTRSVEDWKRCRAAGKNADNLVSASHWLYTTLRRAGRNDEAAAVLKPITPTLDVIENMSYHSLLLLYKGVRTEAEVLAAAGEGASGTAVRYGVSAWQLANGRQADAMKMWERILEGADWPSFGHIARKRTWRETVSNGAGSLSRRELVSGVVLEIAAGRTSEGADRDFASRQALLCPPRTISVGAPGAQWLTTRAPCVLSSTKPCSIAPSALRTLVR
jgi:hypothetical protein